MCKDQHLKLQVLEKLSYINEFSIIVISSSDDIKLDVTLIPNLSIVRLTKMEKSDLINISRTIFCPLSRYHEDLIDKLVSWYFLNIYK